MNRIKINTNQIARDRCLKLLKLAKEMFPADETLARRYVALARKISMRHRIKLGSEDYCRKCGAPFIQGKTVKTRLESKTGFIVLECLKCNTKRRIKKYKR